MDTGPSTSQPGAAAGDLHRQAVQAHGAGRLADAEALYRAALAADPRNAGAQTSLSVLLLRQGRYAEAWPLYEARFDAALPAPAPTRSANYAAARWQGESLAGKSLLLWPEQGLGDYIQVIRYAPMLRQLGVARLTAVCAPPLATLVAGVGGIDEVLSAGAQVTRHDYWLPVMSLPLRFATTLQTIPARIPYVHPDAARAPHWAQRIAGPGLKVGLAWKGSASTTFDAERSLPGIELLRSLWEVPGVTFYSVQHGEAEREGIASGLALDPIGNVIGDFADAAAAIACLDLVICVDSAYVHLAGALGKRCWVLMHGSYADWRWMDGRDDSPWYPSVRLFRVREAGAWEPVIAQVQHALRAHSLAHSGNKP